MEDAKQLANHLLSDLQDISIKASDLEMVRYAKLKRSIEDTHSPTQPHGSRPVPLNQRPANTEGRIVFNDTEISHNSI